MKVPVYDPQVEPHEQQIPEPRFSAPPAEAFGADVNLAKAKEGEAFGKVGFALSSHVANEMYQRSHLAGVDTSEKYRTDVQNLTENNTPKTIKGSDGKDYEVPSGLLNRNLTQADGITNEFDARSNALRQDYLKSLPNDRAKAIFLLRSGYIQEAARNRVITHEATQGRLAKVNAYHSAIQNTVNSAGDAQTPQDLKNIINDIETTNATLGNYRGEDLDTQEKNREKNVSEAVRKAAMTKLNTTGDLSASTDVLDSMQDKISLDSYGNILKQLETGANRIQQAKTSVQKNEQIGNSLSLIDGLTKGTIDWRNIGDLDKMDIPEETKMAFKDALESKNIQPGKPVSGKKDYTIPVKEQAFAQHIADVVNKNDQEGMLQVMNQAMHGFGHGDISQDRLNIIAKLVLQRAKNLPTQSDGQAPETPPKQSAFDAGLKTVLSWLGQNKTSDAAAPIKNYLDATQKGVDPKQAHEDAIKSEVIKQYPKAVTFDNPPNAVVGGDNKARLVFPKKTEDEPARIFNPATGRLEANPKAKAKSAKNPQ